MGLDANLLGTTVTFSAISVFIVNFLKGRKWFPLLSNNTKWANRIVAILLSGLSAVGIHAAWSSGGTLTITGLTLTGILAAGWLWIKSFALQEWIYQSTKQNSAASAPAESPGPPVHELK